MERWRVVKDYPNYMVSDLGRVKNIVTGRILKPGLNTHGYIRFRLSNNGNIRGFSVHILVAIAFLGHIPDGHKIVVDHINNDHTDNRVTNLQLITQRKNTSKDKVRDLPIGVYQRSSGRYYATIGIDNKACYLGSFDTPEAASAAYKQALSDL